MIQYCKESLGNLLSTIIITSGHKTFQRVHKTSKISPLLDEGSKMRENKGNELTGGCDKLVGNLEARALVLSVRSESYANSVGE